MADCSVGKRSSTCVSGSLSHVQPINGSMNRGRRRSNARHQPLAEAEPDVITLLGSFHGAATRMDCALCRRVRNLRAVVPAPRDQVTDGQSDSPFFSQTSLLVPGACPAPACNVGSGVLKPPPRRRSDAPSPAGVPFRLRSRCGAASSPRGFRGSGLSSADHRQAWLP